MHPLIESKREEIAEICRRFGVKRLEIFGSAARGDDFDPATSDADFLVEFHDWAAKPWMGELLEFETALGAALGRNVDLLTFSSLADMRNQYRKRTIEEDRRLVYAQ